MNKIGSTFSAVVQHDETFWHGLGFATLLIQSSGSYMLKIPPEGRKLDERKNIPNLGSVLKGGTLRGRSISRLYLDELTWRGS
jgi:hypothetical protein